MTRIGIIGGGPAALFMLKRLSEATVADFEVIVFEKNEKLGAGMPYSIYGACGEHITNVSDNEIPELETSVADWLQHAPADLLTEHKINEEEFSEYRVLPRLLFGEYLAAQFRMMVKKLRRKGVNISVFTKTVVVDIEDDREQNRVFVKTKEEKFKFDNIVICTGHRWPVSHEGSIEGWYDSPYPPSKLHQKINFPVAIRGASLTAIDAVRSLARANGSFESENGNLVYNRSNDSPNFRMVLHSLDGIMPAVRFHLEDPQLSKNKLLTDEEVRLIREKNKGFVPLDLLYQRNFLEPLKELHPEFYQQICDMKMEEFVKHVMSLRERVDGFTLFKAEVVEAEKSIRRKQSVYWKEMLAALSYAMNYPAKYFSAEDMLRFTKTLKPLISIVIAFVPQSSARELIALHDAGALSLQPVDGESRVEPGEKVGAVYYFKNEDGVEQEQHYSMFVDAIGQRQFLFGEFPFPSLRDQGAICAARIRFRSPEEGERQLQDGGAVDADGEGNYYLHVPGIAINDCFQVLDRYGCYNDRIYILAVPYIGGYNPDYSGLDFCEHASARVLEGMGRT